MYELVGFCTSDFKTDSGALIQGYRVYCIRELPPVKDGVTWGTATESFWFKRDLVGLSDLLDLHDVHPHFDILWNRYGKPQEVRVNV